jgi:hypothetical protein
MQCEECMQCENVLLKIKKQAIHHNLCENVCSGRVLRVRIFCFI